MASLNKVMLIGNLGRDPEVRYMPSGGAMCNISIATTENWRDKNTGDKKEKTEWHRIVMFGKQAELAEQYLKKGSPIYIEGRLQTRKWTTKEGEDKYTTEVIADRMQFLSGRGGGLASETGSKPSNESVQDSSGGPSFPEEEDIPF